MINPIEVTTYFVMLIVTIYLSLAVWESLFRFVINRNINIYYRKTGVQIYIDFSVYGKPSITQAIIHSEWSYHQKIEDFILEEKILRQAKFYSITTPAYFRQEIIP